MKKNSTSWIMLQHAKLLLLHTPSHVKATIQAYKVGEGKQRGYRGRLSYMLFGEDAGEEYRHKRAYEHGEHTAGMMRWLSPTALTMSSVNVTSHAHHQIRDITSPPPPLNLVVCLATAACLPACLFHCLPLFCLSFLALWLHLRSLLKKEEVVYMHRGWRCAVQARREAGVGKDTAMRARGEVTGTSPLSSLQPLAQRDRRE